MISLKVNFNNTGSAVYDFKPTNGALIATFTTPSEEPAVGSGKHFTGYTVSVNKVTGADRQITCVFNKTVAGLGDKIIVTISSYDADITADSTVEVLVAAGTEQVYSVSYYYNDTKLADTGNIREYYASMGDVFLYAPQLGANRRFTGWEVNGYSIDRLSYSMFSAGNIRVEATAVEEASVNLYGNLIEESTASSIDREGGYILLANEIKDTANRSLSGIKVQDFYQAAHDSLTVDGSGKIKLSAYVTEVYVKPVKDGVIEATIDRNIDNVEFVKVIYHVLPCDMFSNVALKLIHRFDGKDIGVANYSVVDGDIVVTHAVKNGSATANFEEFTRNTTGIARMLGDAIGSYIENKNFVAPAEVAISDNASSDGRFYTTVTVSKVRDSYQAGSKEYNVSDVIQSLSSIRDISVSYNGYGNTDRKAENFFDWMNMKVVSWDTSTKDIKVKVVYDRLFDSDIAEADTQVTWTDSADETNKEITNEVFKELVSAFNVSKVPVLFHFSN